MERPALPACFLCPVCAHGFDTQPPLIAPCGHAACIRCVKNLWECPVCQAPPDRWWPCSNLQEGAVSYVKMLMQHSEVPEAPDCNYSRSLLSAARSLPDELKTGRLQRIFAKLPADDAAEVEAAAIGTSARALADTILPRGISSEKVTAVLTFLQAAAQQLSNAPGTEMECRMLGDTNTVVATWPAHVPRTANELARLLSYVRDVFSLRVVHSGRDEGNTIISLCNKTQEQQNLITNFLDMEHPLQEVFRAQLDEALQEATWQRHHSGAFSTICRGDLYNLTTNLLENSPTKKLQVREIRNALDLGVGLNELYILLKELRYSFLVRHQGQLFESMEALEISLGLEYGIDISRGLSQNPVSVYVLAPSAATVWGERLVH